MRQETDTDTAGMSAGQLFVKKIGLLGCILFLGAGVLFLVMCFTTKPAAYTPPHDAAYWSANPAELAQELNDRVLPPLRAEASARTEGDTVIITVPESGEAEVKAAVEQHFPPELFAYEDG